MNWILDGIILVIVVVFVIIFAKKGLMKAIFSLLSGIIAVAIAIGVSGPASEPIEALIGPSIENFVEQSFSQSAEEYAEENNKGSLNADDFSKIIDEATGKLGGFISALGIKSEDIKNQVEGIGSNIKEWTKSLAENVAHGISVTIAFILVFVLALVGLKLIAALIDKIFGLPVLSQLNRLGGALLGLVFGLVASLVFTSFFKLIAPSIIDNEGNPVVSQQQIDNTYLFKNFYNFNF